MNIIVCVDQVYGIGKHGTIPWKWKADMVHFRAITMGNIVVMGRKTWESMGSQPLKGRHNIILSKFCCRDQDMSIKIYEVDDGVKISTSWEFCRSLDELDSRVHELIHEYRKKVFIIGGCSVYDHFLSRGPEKVYLSQISGQYGCDTFFPMSKLTSLCPVLEGEVDVKSEGTISVFKLNGKIQK
jgi:dihydrofolate reductase